MDYKGLTEARDKELSKNREHYALARSLGFTSIESKRLQTSSTETIRRIAAERDAKTEVK